MPSPSLRDLVVDVLVIVLVGVMWFTGKIADTLAIGLLAPLVGAKLYSRTPPGASPPSSAPPGAVMGILLTLGAVLGRGKWPAVGAVIGLAIAAMVGCSSVPVARDVPKPVRVAVEKQGCDAAAQNIADASARAVFLASCYATAEIYGRSVASLAVDAGVR